MMKEIALVALGGGVGSALRFLTSALVGRCALGHFPLPTLAVNVAGCFLMGLLASLLGHGTPGGNTLRMLFVTGFCGGYTTFSTFASENVALLQEGRAGMALLYVAVSAAAGLAAVWAGMAAAR